MSVSMYNPKIMLRVAILSNAIQYLNDKDMFISRCFEWFVTHNKSCKESIHHYYYSSYAFDCMTSGVDVSVIKRHLFFMDMDFLRKVKKFPG